MNTITTKWYGPTNTKGSRIKAETSGGEIKIWHYWNYGISGHKNHVEAARKLKEKLNWEGKMIGGDTQNGMVFVFANEPYEI